MRILPSVVAVLLGLSALGAAYAQSGQQEMLNAGTALQESQAQASAGAARPGDEMLTCDQLQAEMTSSMTSATVQDNMAAIGATAQSERERSERMMAQAKANMAANAALGVAGSFIPGASIAQGAVVQAQMRAQQKEGEKGQRAYAGMMGNMQEMMPTLMRGRRVMELAQGKMCPFVENIPAQ